jgi:hypothetical protein
MGRERCNSCVHLHGYYPPGEGGIPQGGIQRVDKIQIGVDESGMPPGPPRVRKRAPMSTAPLGGQPETARTEPAQNQTRGGGVGRKTK